MAAAQPQHGSSVVPASKESSDATKKPAKAKRRVGSSDVKVATTGLAQYSPEAPRYQIEKLLGKGAYGAVYSAKDRGGAGEGGSQKVALKHVMNAFTSPTDARRIFREIHVMAHFDHPNIVRLMRVLRPREESLRTFEQLYLVTEVMETDLHRVIHSRQDLTSDHISYFLYQLLCGLKHLHSGGVLHRDLKPSNLLVNADCQLKVCDFGLARESEATVSTALTEYVVTRWYRAPEVLLSGGRYKESIDVWSVGCILGELLLRRPLFPGENYLHQLQLIIQTLGSPGEEELHFIRNDAARDFVLRQPHSDGVPYSRLFPHVRGPCLDLLAKMLVFDPDDRISIDEALQHPFLARVRAARKHVCEFSAPMKLRMRHRLRKMSIDQIRDTFSAEFMRPGRWDGKVPAADRQHAPSRPLPPAPPSGVGSSRGASGGGVSSVPSSSRGGEGRRKTASVDLVAGPSSGVGLPSARSAITDSGFRDLESPSTGSAGGGVEEAHGPEKGVSMGGAGGGNGFAGAGARSGGSSRSVARATAEAYLRRRVAPGGRGPGLHGTGAGAATVHGVAGREGAKAGEPPFGSPSDDEEDSKPVRRGGGGARAAPRRRAGSEGAKATDVVASAYLGEGGEGEDEDDDDDDDEFFDPMDEEEEGGAAPGLPPSAAKAEPGAEFPAGVGPGSEARPGHRRGGAGGSGSGFYNGVDDSVQEAQTDEYWSRAQQQLDEVLQRATATGLRSQAPAGALGTGAVPRVAAGAAGGGAALQQYQYDGTSAEYKQQHATLVQVPDELSTPEHEKVPGGGARGGLGLAASLVEGARDGHGSAGATPVAGRRATTKGGSTGTRRRPAPLGGPSASTGGASHFVAAPQKRNDGLPRSVSPMRSPSGSAGASAAPFGGGAREQAVAGRRRVPVVAAPKGMGVQLPGGRGAVAGSHPSGGDALSRQVEAARQGQSARSMAGVGGAADGGAGARASPARSYVSAGSGGRSVRGTPGRDAVGSGGKGRVASGGAAGFTPSPARRAAEGSGSEGGSEARKPRSSLSSAAASMLAGTASPRMPGR